MSLQTSKFIISALQEDEEIVRDTDGRIFYVGRDTSAEDEDKIPYIIVMPGGINSDGTKDEEEMEDTDQIGILVVAETGEALMDLAEAVRAAVRGYWEETGGWQKGCDFNVTQMSFSASAVSLDAMRPCYFQTLNYTINTV